AATGMATGQPRPEPFIATEYFETLAEIWLPPTPEMLEHRSAHAARYDALIHELRTDARLGGLLELLVAPNASQTWRTDTRTPEAWESALGFASELFEFMWTVYDDLGLVHAANLLHPRAQGWVRIFRRWLAVDVMRDAWTTRYRESYSDRFRAF